MQRFERPLRSVERLRLRHVLVLVELRAVLLQLFAERPHLFRVEQIGNQEIAALADLMSDDIALELLAEMRERFDPAADVEVVGVDEGAVDVEEEGLEVHGVASSKMGARARGLGGAWASAPACPRTHVPI